MIQYKTKEEESGIKLNITKFISHHKLIYHTLHSQHIFEIETVSKC